MLLETTNFTNPEFTMKPVAITEKAIMPSLWLVTEKPKMENTGISKTHGENGMVKMVTLELRELMKLEQNNLVVLSLDSSPPLELFLNELILILYYLFILN